ncbi:hypothetical protein SprV_0100327700 [Sparganum proliferum]
MTCTSYEPAQNTESLSRTPSSAAGAREGHLDASSIASVTPAGLCLRPETRPAGGVGDKGDTGCRRADGPSLRYLQDADSPTAPQETSSNELANLPVVDAAAAYEDASVEERWCQLRDTVKSTALAVLGHGRRQHQDWFDDNDAAISHLLAEKNRLHKVYVDQPTDDIRAAFYRKDATSAC